MLRLMFLVLTFNRMNFLQKKEIHNSMIRIMALWISFLGVHAQTILGQVVSIPDIVPIPFATITTQNHKWGITASEEGEFRLDLNLLAKNDTLIVTSVGYFESRVLYRELKEGFKVRLQVQPIQLAEIKVRDTGRRKDIWLGASQKTTNSSVGHISFNGIQEIALFIPNYIQNEGFVNKVSFWISALGKPKTPFRVRIYKNDNGMPGENLLNHNLIVRAKRGKGWFDVDVSKFDIPFSIDGFFIGMEWIVVPDKEYWFDVKYPGNIIKSKFGQSAGTTLEFKEDFGRIRKNGGEWHKYGQSYQPMFRTQVTIYE